MEEPLLSAEETEALLGAMRSAEDESDEADVEKVDLTSPERRIREALSIADRAGEEVALMLRRLMVKHTGAPAEAEASPAEINPFNVALGTVRPGSAIGRLRIGESFGFVTLGPKLVSFILERQMGAPLRMDEDEDRATREELTAVDRRVLKPIIAELASKLSERWCGDAGVVHLLDVSGRVEAEETDDYEPVLRIACEVRPGVSPSDEVSIVFASSAVGIAFGQPEASEAIVSAGERYRMRRRVDVTEVELSAMLGKAQETVRRLLELQVGDVLRLDGVPGDPIAVKAQGVTVLRGHPVTLHGNLAIEVIAAERTEEDEAIQAFVERARSAQQKKKQATEGEAAA